MNKLMILFKEAKKNAEEDVALAIYYWDMGGFTKWDKIYPYVLVRSMYRAIAQRMASAYCAKFGHDIVEHNYNDTGCRDVHCVRCHYHVNEYR